jgi:hypothetical protein
VRRNSPHSEIRIPLHTHKKDSCRASGRLSCKLAMALALNSPFISANIVKTAMEHDHTLEGPASGTKNFHVCPSESVRIDVNKCDQAQRLSKTSIYLCLTKCRVLITLPSLSNSKAV